jgi:hypothetical protein
MVFGVILFTEGGVREGAIGHYNANRIENFATRRGPEDLINRIMVEYARENLVFYDATIEAAAIDAADENALRVIRKNIYQAIGKDLPEACPGMLCGVRPLINKAGNGAGGCCL